MKKLILLYMHQLLNCGDVVQLANLKDKLVTFISVAELDLDEAAKHCTKRLIVRTLQDYVIAPDTALKSILKNYYSTLADVLTEDYAECATFAA